MFSSSTLRAVIANLKTGTNEVKKLKKKQGGLMRSWADVLLVVFGS